MLWIPIRKSTENLTNLITILYKHLNIKPDVSIVLTSVVTACMSLRYFYFRRWISSVFVAVALLNTENLSWWENKKFHTETIRRFKLKLRSSQDRIRRGPRTELKTNRRENCQSCWLLCSSRWNLSLRMTKVWQMTQFQTVFTKLFQGSRGLSVYLWHRIPAWESNGNDGNVPTGKCCSVSHLCVEKL